MSAPDIRAVPAHAWSGILLLLGAFFIPISIAPAQACMYGALVCGMLALVMDRDAKIPFSPAILFIAAFVLCAAFSSWTGLDRPRSLGKLHRFLLLLLVFIVPYLYARRREFAPAPSCLVLVFFVAGTTVLALSDLVRFPWALVQGVGLYDAGNMRDPQFYLVALCLLAAWIMQPDDGDSRVINAEGRRRLAWLAFALCLLVFLLHNKRGAWFSFLPVILLMAAMARQVKLLLAIVVVVFGVTAAGEVAVRGFNLNPQLSLVNRVRAIGAEFDEKQGGRISLWRNVAPDLIRDHPTGVGFKATSYRLLRTYHHNVAAGLDHLHNNPLQIAATLGWAGLLAWCLLMLYMISTMTRSLVVFRARGDPEFYTALGLLAGLLGLLMNGMVEYNWGDSEIFTLFVLLLGLVEMYRLKAKA